MTREEALDVLEAELPAIHTRTFKDLSGEMLGDADLIQHAAFMIYQCIVYSGDDPHEMLTTLAAVVARAYGLGRRSMLQ